MDRRSLTAFNIGIAVVICAIILFSWFYMRYQFMWGVILVVLLLLLAGYINIMRKSPLQGMSASEWLLAVIALLILGFTWFYMREQVCWAAYLVVFLLVFVEFLKLKKWLKDTVSIQVIIHKNEKDDDRKDK